MEVVIPPLIYSAALNAASVEMRRKVMDVASLSVGLVIAASLLVAWALSAAAGIPFAAALALGAAVAPTDPVASLAVGRRSGMPAQLMGLIEGEGLLNDATALTTFQVAVAIVLGGGFSAPAVAGRFLVATVGGVASGLAVAVLLGSVRRRLAEPMSENALSLATPFAAYLLAESFGGSGVLAVAVAGIWFAHRGPSVQSSQSRLQTRAVWRLADYLLEGFVFLLIGQQIPGVVSGLAGYRPGTVAAAAGATVAAVLLVRPVWLMVTGSSRAARLRRRYPGRADTEAGLSGRDVVALSWAGSRGVITLAAAFAIPVTTPAGALFPARDLLIFCAYTTVLVTLVGQGLTFGPLLRHLGFGDTAGTRAVLLDRARVEAARAAADRLDAILASEGPTDSRLAEAIRLEANRRLERFEARLARRREVVDGILDPDDNYYVGIRLRRAVIEVMRDEYVQMRDTGRLPDAAVRSLLHELDHEETLLSPHD